MILWLGAKNAHPRKIKPLSCSGSSSVWHSVHDSRQEAVLHFRNVKRWDSGLDKRLISELRHVSSLAALYLIPFTTI
jgi:hypothetical protein